MAGRTIILRATRLALTERAERAAQIRDWDSAIQTQEDLNLVNSARCGWQAMNANDRSRLILVVAQALGMAGSAVNDAMNAQTPKPRQTHSMLLQNARSI